MHVPSSTSAVDVDGKSSLSNTSSVRTVLTHHRSTKSYHASLAEPSCLVAWVGSECWACPVLLALLSLAVGCLLLTSSMPATWMYLETRMRTLKSISLMIRVFFRAGLEL